MSAHDVMRFCREFGIPHTRFGREAVGDPRLVGDMQRGRTLRPATAEKVCAYMGAVAMSDERVKKL